MPTSSKTTRPALERLEIDIKELIQGSDSLPGLEQGFETRSQIVEWEQRLVVRTLGEIPQWIYLGIGQQLASPDERPLEGVFIKDSTLSSNTAKDWRKLIRKDIVQTGFDLAYKKLRAGAAEYNTQESDEDIDPSDQENLLMRPALTKMDKAQHSVLDELLDGGLDSREAIVDWGLSLEHATYGESVWIPGMDNMSVSRFVSFLHRRDPWAEMVTQDRLQRTREAFAARVLIPTFNNAVRVLAGHSGEFLDQPENGDTGVNVDV